MALGRPGTIITGADVQSARHRFTDQLEAEIDRVQQQDPPEIPPPASLAKDTSLYTTLRGQVDFFTGAYALASLAADTVVRIDGHVIPDANVQTMLKILEQSVYQLNGYAGTVSVAGLRANFTIDRQTRGVIVAVDCAGSQQQFAPDVFPMILNALRDSQPLTRVAKMEVGLAEVGRRITDSRDSSLVRPSRSTLPGLGKPGTAGAHHQGTLGVNGGRSWT
ncbi:hypothetical protein D5S17_36090 [Pseudonocardiaceae bacterium YIM PH 21723]|nr:hypothetical protein D5S17_36090 [Pseudonocardiaceae bacterium YIM PH 21723]